MFRIVKGNEVMFADEEGNISRPQIGMKASGQWELTGAVRYNNFGGIAERWSLTDIKYGPTIQWKYKNGKQRVYATDWDHGTNRIWASPSHSIQYIPIKEGK